MIRDTNFGSSNLIYSQFIEKKNSLQLNTIPNYEGRTYNNTKIRARKMHGKHHTHTIYIKICTYIHTELCTSKTQ